MKNYLNKKFSGKAALPPKFADFLLFPAITLGCPGDSVHLNFGNEEWQFKDFKRVLE